MGSFRFRPNRERLIARLICGGFTYFLRAVTLSLATKHTDAPRYFEK